MLLLTFGISGTNIVGMTELTLKEFLKNQTQQEAAIQLGVNQSAVSQMLAAGRDIRIRLNSAGAVIEHFEIKPVGRSSVQAA